MSFAATTKLVKQQLKAQGVDKLVPVLSSSSHKGSSGRIGIIGGCREYTGAPYYAAMSVLRAGGDLAHVFCEPEAATPLKSYSPDVIVHPVHPDNPSETLAPWLPRLHAIVIGPGMGREGILFRHAPALIAQIRAAGVHLVIDGDALSQIAASPAIIAGTSSAVLTPNGGEWPRLIPEGADKEKYSAGDMAKDFAGVTVLRKGKVDEISDGVTTILSDRPDEYLSLRRCGGQGDILAGLTGLAMGWGRIAHERGLLGKDPVAIAPLAAYLASSITREASYRAFTEKRRGMLTPDVIEQLPSVMNDLFD